MRSDQVQIGKFGVKSDIIQVRYKVYTGLCNRGQGFSDFHGVDLWYLVRKPNINRSRYIEKCQNIKVSKIITDTKWISYRLKEYVRENDINLHERIFPICYEAARTIVRKAGNLVGIHLRPHDLRRYAATYASRCGVLLEIVSKVILRHSNLATTQMYLGKISDADP